MTKIKTNILKIIVLGPMMLILMGCVETERTFFTETELLDITDASIEEVNIFSCQKKENYYMCSFVTTQIRKEQKIDTIKTYCRGHEMVIHISLDKDLFPMPHDQISKVIFRIYQVPKGKYNIRNFVENVEHNVNPNRHVF